MRAIAIALLWVSAAFGQIGDPQVETWVQFRAEGLKVAGDSALAPVGSKIMPQFVGVLSLNVEAAIVRVKASDAERVPVPVEKSEIDGSTVYLIQGSGKVWIDIRCIDFDKKIYDEKQITAVIGNPDAPLPEPIDPDPVEPDPDPPSVPADRFDNISQRVAKWSAGLPLKDEVAASYRAHADELDLSAQPEVVSAKMVRSRDVILGSEKSKWADLLREIVADFNQRIGDMQKHEVAEYWRAIANGLDPQPEDTDAD